MPVVKDISGEAVPALSKDGGNEILKSDRIPAMTNSIDVSAKWVPSEVFSKGIQ